MCVSAMWINVPFVLTWTTHSYFSLFYFNNVDFHFKFDIWQINAKNISLKEKKKKLTPACAPFPSRKKASQKLLIINVNAEPI